MSFDYKNLCTAEFLAESRTVQNPTVLIAAPHLIALSWFSPRPTSKTFKKYLELENGCNFGLCKVIQLACTTAASTTWHLHLRTRAVCHVKACHGACRQYAEAAYQQRKMAAMS